MGKLNIILTADYEVYGNGSGCIDKCVIDPSERITQLCDKYNAKVTYFVDVCEYWAFKEVQKSGKFENGFDPAYKIEEQIKDFIKRGHDVQLHFHPQWLDYRYLGNREWQLNQEFWRLPDVDLRGENAIYDLFKQGKETLESILKTVKSDYRCDVFRAGAWCIQPEENVLKAMNRLDFRIDSSVAAGIKFNDGKTIFDFTDAKDGLPAWAIANNVCQPEKEGRLKEVPIFTTKVPGLKMFQFNALKVLKRIPFIPIGCSQNGQIYQKQSLFFKIIRSTQSQQRMFNFCDATSFEEMKFMTIQAKRKYRDYLYNNVDAPVVVIGHPKTFGNAREFEKYLKWATGKEYLKFSTYRY
jgi:hypothetical protein